MKKSEYQTEFINKRQQLYNEIFKEGRVLKAVLKGGTVEDGWEAVGVVSGDAWGGDMEIKLKKGKEQIIVALEDLKKINPELE